MVEEESFPRGGRVVRKRPPQEVQQLFTLNKPPKAKKQKKSNIEEPEKSAEELFESAISIRGSLTYKQMQTGMVILGCVRNIMNVAMEVELPGYCFANVKITDISDSLTSYLSQQLEKNEPETDILRKMFLVGEYLLLKITNIDSQDNTTKVHSTINPREIYTEFHHNSFKKDMLVWSCVSGEADHGYEMSLGVKNCRAFLPSKNVDSGINYVIGKPLWCVIHRVDAAPAASTVRLSAKTEHIKAIGSDIENLHTAIPGTKVELFVEKVVAHGIRGKFSEKFIGYVDENFLTTPLKKPSDYQEGKLLKAYVLFVEPTTKVSHLTLRYPERDNQPECNIGDIVQAEVFSQLNTGMTFILPNDLKGFATNRRLINTLAKKPNINLTEALKSKFPVGSRHKCRILDYNHISKTFICTPEVSVVKDDQYMVTDLSPGQLVEVKILDVKEEGILVLAGHIRGFVPNLHISNTEYSSNVKKKFKPGQKVNARVFTVNADEKKVIFTLKPALVENDSCLTKMQDAHIGSKFPGIVVKLTETSALVVFYNNIKGFVGLKGMGNEATDPSKYFFLGQVVNLYIWRRNASGIQLSLFKPEIKSDLPNVGGRYVGIVKLIEEKGINIQIESSSKRGFIPNAHVSGSLSLCKAIKGTFKPGDKINDLMYMGGHKLQIYSRREGMVGKLSNLPSLKELKVGSLIRCSYERRTDNGLFVLPHIQNCSEVTYISKKNIGENIPELVPYQFLSAKIIKLDRKKKKIELSIKLEDVFDKKVESVIGIFTEYVQELARLYQHSKRQKLAFCKYSLGERVTCKIESLNPQGGCNTLLPNGAKGIVKTHLCPKKLKQGDEVTGVVIAHDYENHAVDLCLRQEIASRINAVQDGNLQQALASSMSEKILVKDECLISVLKHPIGNKQLICLPMKLHQNDFKNSCALYYEKKKINVCICGKSKKFLIGMNKRLFVQLDKSLKRNRVAQQVIKVDEISTKRQNSESDSGIEPEGGNEVDVDSSDSEEPVTNKEVASSTAVALPGVSTFFSTLKVEPIVYESSSDDEDNGPTEKKRKKLSPAERAELLRQEEERISKIEKELADPTKLPESAEQFDRLLLAKPNSAELWTRYIAFHIANTEIEKARAVAKRALDTINMTLTDEKFKVWMVLLTLENMFGTKESFDKVFEDALKFNDSLSVYLKAIEILAENAKYQEMEEKINKARTKHKQEIKMWLEVGKTYYQIGKLNDARNCKDRALKSITEKKSQMSLIVRFAIMEFKHGEPDQGCAIFEAILTSDPRKVNVWTTYVDQLVKLGRVDEARQLLERSVCQKLPLKSMKTLFMKFRKFEEVHGTPETIEAVKQRAQDYVVKFKK